MMELPAASCSVLARDRAEPVRASALARSRFMLIEVPGPWGRAALTESRLDPDLAGKLAGRAEQAGVRIILIRRPGQRPPGGTASGGPAWALADTSPGAELIQWGRWPDPADLLGLDLATRITDAARSSGPQRVALACTNAKRDRCCALLGRPVAAAIAAAGGWDAWECSHLGGHRFAANLLLLPAGHMFGQLGPDSAVAVLRRFEQGEILLRHHRGRCGQRPEVQAALHTAAVRLGDARVAAVLARSWRPAGDGWEVDVTHWPAHGQPATYQVRITGTELPPAALSCADQVLKPAVRYDETGFRRVR
jgi:hypothetical protein